MNLKDKALKDFILSLLNKFGGNDLLSRVTVTLEESYVLIEADKESIDLVHGALILCGEYRGYKCKFTCLDEFTQ